MKVSLVLIGLLSYFYHFPWLLLLDSSSPASVRCFMPSNLFNDIDYFWNILYRKEITRKGSIVQSTSFVRSWLDENLECLKVPLMSPTVYKPLLLSVLLLIIQSCAGDAYISKFIIQIINSETARNSSIPKNISTNSEKSCQQEDAQDYILPLVIQTVKLIVILFMTFLLRKIQIQVLYFLSLIFTVILLLLLGLIW